MSGHTPGPWMFNVKTNTVEDTEGVPVCSLPTLEAESSYEQTILADARLIAAAPDLLAALRLAREALAEVCDMRSGYGAFPGGDPRDFTPDPECSMEEERAAHVAACAKAEVDEAACELEPSHRWYADGDEPEGGVITIKTGALSHVEFPMFGLGTHRDRIGAATLRAVDDAVAKAEGK